MLTSRRGFLGSTAAACFAGRLFAADEKVRHPKALPEHATFDPATLFLTWHRDPTTTMVIQWVGTRGETADTDIYYSAAQSNRNLDPLVPPKEKTSIVGPHLPWLVQSTMTRPFPETDFKVFRAELTNLTPDTLYHFRIGRRSPVYKFRTMPAKATDAIHFISGGDCGVNDAAIANNRQAAKQDPMFALIGGDLGYDNGRSVEVSLAFLRNYSRTMIGRDGRLIPLITCIGNHEVNGGYNKPREAATFFFPLFEGLYPETSYATLDFGDYLSLILLDTGHVSSIAGAQADWLEKQLKARCDHPHTIVVQHVPSYPSHRNPEVAPVKPGKDPKPGTGEASRQHWVPLFERYRVPLVLEHHDHTFKRTMPLIDGRGDDDGVLYLGDGSWGRIRTAKKPESTPYLRKTSEDFHLSLHRIEGLNRFHMALDEQGRITDVCQTGQRRKGTVAVTRQSH